MIWGPAAVLASLVVLGLAPVSSTLDRGTVADASEMVRGSTGPAGGLNVSVTWNGAGIAQAGSASAGFVIGAGQTAMVRFSYSGAGALAVRGASVLVLFLGLTLSSLTTVVKPAAAGEAVVNWSFGSAIYITEGAYKAEAQLSDANGSVLFSEPFYVDARAPYVFGSAIPAMAALIGLAEAFWIRTVIRYRRHRRGRYRYR